MFKVILSTTVRIKDCCLLLNNKKDEYWEDLGFYNFRKTHVAVSIEKGGTKELRMGLIKTLVILN